MKWLAIFRQSRQPLDGQDLSSVCLHGEEETRPNGLAVEKNRAAAADSLLAAQMSSGEPKMVAQEVSQRQTRLHKSFTLFTVDGQLNGKLCHHHRSLVETATRFSAWFKFENFSLTFAVSAISYTLTLDSPSKGEVRVRVSLCDASSSSTRLGLRGISFT